MVVRIVIKIRIITMSVTKLLVKQKEIPCYKMVLNYTGKDFKLIPVLYGDYINSK